MKSGRVVHPILISLFPVLALIAGNLSQISLGVILRPLLVSFLFGALIWVFTRGVLRDPWRAGLLATTLIAFLLSAGHIRILLGDALFLGVTLGRTRHIFFLGFLLLGLVLWWSYRSRKSLGKLNASLNIITGVLLLIPLVQISAGLAGRFFLSGNRDRPTQAQEGSNLTDELSGVELKSDLPDIYYIIPDMYTSEGVLKERFQFDNSEFVAWLEERGFYVASCSFSNYGTTVWSLASSLNLAYLDEIDESLLKASQDPYAYSAYVKSNATRTVLEYLGYKIVAIETGFSPTNWTDADPYLAFSAPGFSQLFAGLNSFETLYMRTTAGYLVFDFVNYLPLSWRVNLLDSAYIEHRGRILFALDELGKIPSRVEGPKLVFVHLLAPHDPFVFGPDGEYLERFTPFTLNNDIEYSSWEKFSAGYAGQVTYLNHRFKDIITTIIESSNPDPIIILQGDHGIPRLIEGYERYAILNAVRIPGAEPLLNSRISPVNTIRLLLSTTFDLDLPPIQNTIMVSKSEEDPYEFEAIPMDAIPCGRIE